jgi:hypothetical protein
MIIGIKIRSMVSFDNDHHVDTPYGNCHVEIFVDVGEQSKCKLTRAMFDQTHVRIKHLSNW